jgi:hypothetical protein
MADSVSLDTNITTNSRHQKRFLDTNFTHGLSCRRQPSAIYSIIIFGKTSFGNMRGKKPGPVKTIFRHLCYLSRMKRNIFVITMDAYLTSQICANCDQRTLKHVKERQNFDVIWSEDTYITPLRNLQQDLES